MAAPVTLSARAIVQHLWKAKVNWDDALDPETSQRWNRWKNQVAFVSPAAISRRDRMYLDVTCNCTTSRMPPKSDTGRVHTCESKTQMALFDALSSWENPEMLQ